MHGQQNMKICRPVLQPNTPNISVSLYQLPTLLIRSPLSAGLFQHSSILPSSCRCILARSPHTMRFGSVINLHSAVVLLAITTDKAKINDWLCDVLLSLLSLMPTFRAIFGNPIFIASTGRHHPRLD